MKKDISSKVATFKVEKRCISRSPCILVGSKIFVAAFRILDPKIELKIITFLTIIHGADISQSPCCKNIYSWTEIAVLIG